MDYLYDGMVTPHDIHDADGKLLLMRQGHKLNISQIEAIRRFNKGRDMIQVSAETHKMIMQHNPTPKKRNESVRQARVEKETGYTDVKDEAFTMITEISQTKVPPHDKIQDISRDLSSKVEKTNPGLILELINALAPVDEYLQRHCVNVSLLNGLIGKWLGLPKETVDMLILVGLVHDCGKAAIPPQILNAPRKLTVTEFEVIKMHTVYTYEMLGEFPETVRCGARGHHEKFDGRGYPKGLLGNDIPLAAQITAVSDIYDAMVSQRAYKTPRNPFNIIMLIKKLGGTELEKTIADVFIENMPKEMLNKPALLSNGEIGIVHEIDWDDLEHPYIKIGQKVFKSSTNLYCTQMYMEERGVKV
jgi:HD-GYP domain-containing protein (c-di-GMP phosphodiesterase class II)